MARLDGTETLILLDDALRGEGCRLLRAPERIIVARTPSASGSRSTRSVMVPRPSIASTALSTRLVQTWFSSDPYASISGTSWANSRTTSTPSRSR